MGGEGVTCANPNCGSDMIYAAGLCSPCYQHRRRHGEERIPGQPRYRRAVPHKCFNPACDKVIMRGKRCDNCQRYWRKYGAERPEAWCRKLYYRGKKHCPPICRVCGATPVVSYGRCNACAKYWKHHQKPRPRYLWDKGAGCFTCGYPLANLARKEKCGGRCSPCHKYQKRTGKERPSDYWGVIP